MATRKLSPIHPGEILATDFLKPLGLAPAVIAIYSFGIAPEDSQLSWDVR